MVNLPGPSPRPAATNALTKAITIYRDHVLRAPPRQLLLRQSLVQMHLGLFTHGSSYGIGTRLLGGRALITVNLLKRFPSLEVTFRV